MTEPEPTMRPAQRFWGPLCRELAFVAAITIVLALIGRSTLRQTATHLFETPADTDTEQVSAPDSETHACACFHAPADTTSAAPSPQSPGSSAGQSESSSNNSSNRNLCALWMSGQAAENKSTNAKSAASSSGPGCTECLSCCQQMVTQAARL